jgi:hypothetical protein
MFYKALIKITLAQYRSRTVQTFPRFIYKHKYRYLGKFLVHARFQRTRSMEVNFYNKLILN